MNILVEVLVINVLIIGLKDLHINVLKSKFKGIKFTVINKGTYVNLPKANEFNLIFNLTRFSNHSVHNTYKGHLGYECIEGGRSILSNILRDKLNQLS